MLSDSIQQALNEQISRESFASRFYLAMASWCDHKGLQGSAKFLYEHAQTEREHMMKLFRYVNDAGGHARVRELPDPSFEFENLKEIFEKTLEHERHITGTINQLVDLCLAEKDHSSFNFLQWYVSEQHEEEKLFKLILDKINMIGIDGRGIFWIDKEIGKLAGTSTATS